MKVYRISKCNYIDDLSGTGAALYPGRWHNKGTYILYTAMSPSLALLESLAHITTVIKLDLCMVCLEVPENSIQELAAERLPKGWAANPPPDPLKIIGDRFVKEEAFLALKVPSVVMPEEHNYLLNPAHPEFERVRVLYTRRIPVDERLVRKS
ncbi:hypothetical protein A8C56_17360 [Niabella ginsenosidivorans]|uniref:RES domain-containing protein n=1 Tax=Niabella ginsenosidivorans TaxID=1176587 RepID=A0A1A9I4M3_9BACT|nr:RES family NAD+ phosphorylase [Niabella ginsenosidivorans]ANH82503.1 hypothetical protein A8C56_17360 [Niabella ginsenosidivorans]